MEKFSVEGFANTNIWYSSDGSLEHLQMVSECLGLQPGSVSGQTSWEAAVDAYLCLSHIHGLS